MIIRTDYVISMANNALSITFTNPVVLEKIHRIVNVTQGGVLYSTETGQRKFGASLTENTLTLANMPKFMNETDKLAIEYLEYTPTDIAVSTPNTSPNYASDSMPTYSAVIRNLSLANNPTCIVSISGFASKVIELVKVEAYITSSTTAGQIDVSLVKGSALNTGGASTLVSGTSYDSSDALPTAVVRSYTTNPTLGTVVGSIAVSNTAIGLGSATPPIPFKEVFIGRDGIKRPTIRGVNEVIYISLNGGAILGTRLVDVYLVWTEKPTN